MPNITYYFLNDVMFGKWPGKSIRQKDGRVTKTGQIHLGKVISKEKQIFWKRSLGYFHFDTETLQCTEVAPDDMPAAPVEQDRTRKSLPVIVDFGDAYFLDRLIRGIGYDSVLKSIGYPNSDSLHTMLMFYILDSGIAKDALSWYRQNYVSYLFPGANITSQRISELLVRIGEPECQREFLKKHIEYVGASSGEELSILIDSTGLPNSGSMSITRVSRHESEVNIEFRLIAVVQKRTGLPLYYEYVPGNIVDTNTLKRITLMLGELGHKVDYCIGDSAYSCPSNIERLVLSGIEFMTRLNPAFDMYKTAVAEHMEELMNNSDLVRYGDRYINIVKIQSVIAHEKDSGKERHGWIYLCCDIEARASKTSHFFKKHGSDKNQTAAEGMKECEKFGIFALISTRDLPETQILPEYYARQGVEQYFDFGKNYAHFLPVGKHNENTLRGHLMLAFIASFFFVLIKNRLGIVGETYVELPLTSRDKGDEEGSFEIEVEAGENRYLAKLLEQRTYPDIAGLSSKGLFKEMRGHKADVFDSRFITSVPTAQARQFYESFGIVPPAQVVRSGKKLTPLDASDNLAEDKISRKKIFAYKSPITNEEVLSRREKRARALEEKTRKELAAPVSHQESAGVQEPVNASEELPKTRKKGGGRPKGAKNKKTLEREQRIRDGLEKPPVVRHTKGRPPGAKNKATLERERKIASGEIIVAPKREVGRPKGSKDKKPRKRKSSPKKA